MVAARAHNWLACNQPTVDRPINARGRNLKRYLIRHLSLGCPLWLWTPVWAKTPGQAMLKLSAQADIRFPPEPGEPVKAFPGDQPMVPQGNAEDPYKVPRDARPPTLRPADGEAR